MTIGPGSARRIAAALAVGLAPVLAGGSALAQAASPPEAPPPIVAPPPPPPAVDPTFALMGLDSLAQSDPAAALAEIERLLRSGSLDGDMRLLIDLNAMAADLLDRLGRTAEAARVYLELGFAAQGLRDRTGIDPVPFWRRSSAAFEAAGDPLGALEAEEAILDAQRDGALPRERQDETLARLAQLAEAGGEPGLAQDYRSRMSGTVVPLDEAILGGLAEAPASPSPEPSGGGGSPDDSDGETAMAQAAPPEPAPVDGTRGLSHEDGFSRVEVFYATDRARTGDDDPSDFYGSDRGELEFGIAEVTIPHDHRPGVIETPSIWRLEFAPDPARHVALRSVTPLDEAPFWDRMTDTLEAAEAPDAVVYIHGFSIGFDEAARRAAQLAFDMRYPGVPVLYSWPSRGTTMGYMADAASVELSARRLSRFLEEIAARSGARRIHVVAHSMGNIALTEALELLALRADPQPGEPPMFGQVVFAAPDVDADLFAEVLPTIAPLAERMTLYASESDWALTASRRLHGGEARAGEGGAAVLALDGLDSVDMSELGEDMLAHRYLNEEPSALADLVALMWRNAPPRNRCGLAEVDGGLRPTWAYRPGDCPDREILEVMAALQGAGIDDRDAAAAEVDRLVTDPTIKGKVAPLVMRLFAD